MFFVVISRMAKESATRHELCQCWPNYWGVCLYMLFNVKHCRGRAAGTAEDHRKCFSDHLRLFVLSSCLLFFSLCSSLLRVFDFSSSVPRLFASSFRFFSSSSLLLLFSSSLLLFFSFSRLLLGTRFLFHLLRPVFEPFQVTLKLIRIKPSTTPFYKHTFL